MFQRALYELDRAGQKVQFSQVQCQSYITRPTIYSDCLARLGELWEREHPAK